MIRLSYLIIFCLISFNCCKEPSNQIDKKEKQIYSLDHIYLKSNQPRKTFRNASLNNVLGYNSFYIGKISPILSVDFPLNSEYLFTNESLYKHPTDSSDIRVYVDTTKVIPNVCNTVIPKKYLYNHKSFKIDEFNNHTSYPVFIENISSDTLIIGSTNGLPLHLQILSPKGIWIETNHFIPGCGTGLKLLKLLPHHISITAHPITYGNIKTKFRFAYGYRQTTRNQSKYIYSNEFYGHIDSSFFNQKIPF